MLVLELRVMGYGEVRIRIKVRDAYGTKRLGTKRLGYEMSGSPGRFFGHFLLN